MKTLPELETDLPNMTLAEIAEEIKRDWKNVYFGAVPYLKALQFMESIKDNFGADPGSQVVVYFLSHAQTWRGPVAKLVKKELNKRLK